MAKVAAAAGATERLIYQHFGTRENFLYECYCAVNREIAARFDEIPVMTGEGLTPEETVRTLWTMFFQYLVKGGNNTLFYLEYRNSENARVIRAESEEERNSCFRSFVRLFNSLNSRFHVEQKVNIHVLWAYLLDVTGLFASRVIRGQLPATEESFESVWKLFSGGVLGLMD